MRIEELVRALLDPDADEGYNVADIMDMDLAQVIEAREEADLLAVRYESGEAFLIDSARRRMFAILASGELPPTQDHVVHAAQEAARETLRVES